MSLWKLTDFQITHSGNIATSSINLAPSLSLGMCDKFSNRKKLNQNRKDIDNKQIVSIYEIISRSLSNENCLLARLCTRTKRSFKCSDVLLYIIRCELAHWHNQHRKILFAIWSIWLWIAFNLTMAFTILWILSIIGLLLLLLLLRRRRWLILLLLLSNW